MARSRNETKNSTNSANSSSNKNSTVEEEKSKELISVILKYENKIEELSHEI